MRYKATKQLICAACRAEFTAPGSSPSVAFCTSLCMNFGPAPTTWLVLGRNLREGFL